MANNGLPQELTDNDRMLEELMGNLEKGAVPSPEETVKPIEAPVVKETVVQPPVAETKDLEDRLGKANQRYKTLEGMMKADRKRQVEIIEGLEQQLTENRVANAEAPLDIASILSEEEIAEFGETGVLTLQKLAGAIAQREVNKKVLEVEQRLTDMQKRVDQAEASAGGNTTWDNVEKINPGANEINSTDQGWFEFLATVDPISGMLYRDLGEAAANVNDVQRLSELIDLYRTSANLAKPVIPVKPAQTPVAPNNDGNRLAPVVEKRIYSQDEIREFYEHRARGLREGITKGLTAEQIEALELDIDAAMEEGRVKL